MLQKGWILRVLRSTRTTCMGVWTPYPDIGSTSWAETDREETGLEDGRTTEDKGEVTRHVAFVFRCHLAIRRPGPSATSLLRSLQRPHHKSTSVAAAVADRPCLPWLADKRSGRDQAPPRSMQRDARKPPSWCR
jgi:hypothetical protein